MDMSRLILVIIGVLLIVIAFVLFRKFRSREKRRCPQCGMELEDFMEECVYCSDVTDVETKGVVSVKKREPLVREDRDARILDDDEDTDVVPLASPDRHQEKTLSRDSAAAGDVIEDLSDYLLDEGEQEEKILKQLQRTTILTRMPFIEVIRGKKRLKKVRLNKELFYFGRELGCDFVIEEAGIDDRHAVVKLEGKRSMLFALAQNKSIDVNGQQVSKKELEDGDVIRIGSFSFVFRIEERI